MRTLVLFRGAPGCGKSTLIDKLNWRSCALSADELRLKFSGLRLDVNGNYIIDTSSIEKLVWDTLFQMLDVRMENGDFTVIDATNSKAEEINRYKKMADKYKYRIYLIDMTSLPIKECKLRNSSRMPVCKRVPNEVIDKMYSRFKTQSIPSGIKVIKYIEDDENVMNEIRSITDWKIQDLSRYDEIIHIGDIHGCYDALMEALGNNGKLDDNKYYIFCGDYLDRGIQNAEVMQYMLSIYEKPNVMLLEGNHERHLRDYADNIETISREFNYRTKVALDNAHINKADIKRFYKKCSQLAYYKYDNLKVLVTHGGIPIFIDIGAVKNYSTRDIIKGVGRYPDHHAVDDSFSYNNRNDNFIQIHGHRNVYDDPVQSSAKTYNLEGSVEYGKYIRTVSITHESITTNEIKNNVFREDLNIGRDAKIDDPNKKELTVEELIELFRRDKKNINEKQFGNVSSFNFSQTAFNNRTWNNMTIKARGLYINTSLNKIIARGYEKFFKINENDDNKLSNLMRRFKFPLNVYVKENGYLGLISYDEEKDELFFATKSNFTEGDYANWFKEIFTSKVSPEKLKLLKADIKLNNYTLLCEVIDQTRDPHIIKYNTDKDIYLLACIKNQMEFSQFSYESLTEIGENLGLKVKDIAMIINNWAEFMKFYDTVTARDYKYNDHFIEGFVIEDSNDFLVKLKTDYYDFWKRMRSIVPRVLRLGYIEGTSSLFDDRSNLFYGYLRSLYQSDPINCSEKYGKLSIMKLRDMFEEYNKEE